MTEFITEWIPDAHLYREPIVRCKDCRHFTAGNREYATCDWCDWWSSDTEPDGFCAWGERREG